MPKKKGRIIMMMNPTMTNPMFPQQMNYNTPQNHNGINWVQGIEGAKAFQMVPSSNAVLLDSDNDGIFYIKVADNVGMCSLRTFKFEEITNAPSGNVDLTGYVKKDELAALVKSIMEDNRNEQTVSTVKSNKTITH